MAPHSLSPTTALKTELRNASLARRDRMEPEVRLAGSQRIAATVLAIPEFAGEELVGAFWPIRSEVDPRPIIDGLFARGQRVALPHVTPEGLVFREWRAGEALVPGKFGLSEPRADLPAVDPGALIVPLAAFDRRGQRIGYGRGYYDGAIARLSRTRLVLTVGIGFSCQEIETVPAEPHDRPLQHLVTEDGMVLLHRQ